MIAAQKNGQVESNLTAQQQVKMGIDPKAFAHIMSILTDLYSNRILAVIREYSTNAWDAQVEAGVQRPIEVKLPTRFSPFFAVRDFGVGLSVEDIHVIYSQYGASTKRGTNDQVGMLGLGCKSALTYTTQFTVTSVQNGVKTQVIVSRDADGSGSMHIADTSTTTDPDGTTVTVPVMAGDIDRFGTEARTFFSFWPEGHALVNGASVPRVIEGAMKVTDDIYVVQSENRYSEREHKVVMGNVAYPAPKLGVKVPQGHYVVAFVGIGEVNFAPSREALMDGEPTDGTLARVADAYRAGIVKAVEDAIGKQPSRYEALKASFKWEAFLSGQAVTYKGEAIPTALEHPQVAIQKTSWPRFAPDHKMKPEERPFTLKSKGYKTKTNGQWSIDAKQWDHYIWVEGWAYASLSRTQAAKLYKYIADNDIQGVGPYGGIHPTAVLYSGKFTHTKWLRPGAVIQWADIEKVQLPKRSDGAGYAGMRKTGSFDCYVNGEWKSEVDANDIDDKHPVYYYAGPQAYGRAGIENRVLNALGRKFTIVTMPLNRRDKFIRDFPKTKPLNNVVQAEYEAWAKRLSADTRKALAIHDADVKRDLSEIDASLVNDPAIKEAVRLAKIDLTKTLEQRKVFENALPWGTVKRSGYYTSPLTKYPLYTAHGMRADRTHTYWYLNAAYAANV